MTLKGRRFGFENVAPLCLCASVINRATSMLLGAKTAVKVLEVREVTSLAYDVTKRAALRKMVLDAAMRAQRPHRSVSRRNPLYGHLTLEQAAWRYVTCTFHDVAGWASEGHLALARLGMRQA